MKNTLYFAPLRLGAFAFLLLLVACGGEPPPPLARETAVAEQATALETPPPTVGAGHHLIYLHGKIIEDQGRRPTHPSFGLYLYDEILTTFSQRGFEVHSEVRPAGADAAEYANKVVLQVQELIGSGVPPEQITVVGFSKGGAIAVLASSLLANDQVNFVFLAACGEWFDRQPKLLPHGNLLSIRETSDDLVGSCESLFARTRPPTRNVEITMHVGGGHGAFYQPLPEWVDAVVDFVAGAPNAP